MNVVVIRSNDANPDPRVEKTIRALLSRGHNVMFLGWNRLQTASNTRLKLTNIDIEANIFNKRSSFGGGIKNLLKLAHFQLFILVTLFKHRHRYDAIHAADFDTALAATAINFCLKKKFVYDIFDYYADAFPIPKMLLPAIRYLDTRIINRADALILTAEARIKQIGKAKPKNIVYIHNVPPVAKLTHIQTAPKDKAGLRIAYVGVLQPDRLIIELINAVSKRSNWTLDIAGFGPLEMEISTLAKIHENINFHGKVDYQKSLAINSKADILIATYNPAIPNHRYSTPNKLYEAMHLSKPIIVCQDTGVDEVVEEHSIGYVIRYGQTGIDDILNTIEKNEDILIAQGNRANSLYNQSFSWEIMEQRLIKLYDFLETDLKSIENSK